MTYVEGHFPKFHESAIALSLVGRVTLQKWRHDEFVPFMREWGPWVSGLPFFIIIDENGSMVWRMTNATEFALAKHGMFLVEERGF